MIVSATALRNHNRTAFEEMTSWKAFKTEHMKSKYFWIFVMKILNFKNDEEIA